MARMTDAVGWPTSQIRARSRSDLPDQVGILRHQRVAGQKRDGLRNGLGDQHTVEWVLVQRRQKVDGDGMGARDRKFDIAVVDEAAPQKARPKLPSAP